MFRFYWINLDTGNIFFGTHSDPDLVDVSRKDDFNAVIEHIKDVWIDPKAKTIIIEELVNGEYVEIIRSDYPHQDTIWQRPSRHMIAKKPTLEI
jgi:hypothetical protein